MSQPSIKRESPPSEVRMVVEVDGTPVGFLNLDLTRLWPLISHRKRDHSPVEWMDDANFDSMVCAAVVKWLLARMGTSLFRALGDEMVQAELDVETINLKVEAAVQAFGRTKLEIEKLA